MTPKQRALATQAYRFPVILDRTTSLIARHLENKCLGTIEDGASGDVIFRLNQAGCDAVHASVNTSTSETNLVTR